MRLADLLDNDTPTRAAWITGTTATVVDTFGPGAVALGDCRADTLNLVSGQLDIHTDTDFAFAIPVDAVTTDRFRATQYVVVSGTTGAAAVPEPGTAALDSVAFILLALAGALRRRRALAPAR